MSTIQVCLGKGIRRFFRGFLMLVLMMPRMRGLRLGGLVTAILRYRCERDLQWKKAQKKNEKQTLHLAREFNIDSIHRQTCGRMLMWRLPSWSGQCSLLAGYDRGENRS